MRARDRTRETLVERWVIEIGLHIIFCGPVAGCDQLKMSSSGCAFVEMMMMINLVFTKAANAQT